MEHSDFMRIAEREAEPCRDTRTEVGAVIVKVIGRGYICMPMGQDDDFPWCTRKKVQPNVQHQIYSEHKHLYVCHAELNAITDATTRSTMYVTLNPCNECAKLIAQSGIKEVSYKERRYEDTFNAARSMFDTIGIKQFLKEHVMLQYGIT